jgi:hypothetical protein
MLPIHATPLLLSLLVGWTLGLAAWGLARSEDHKPGIGWSYTPDGLLIGLLALAAFAIGAFVIYVLVTVAVR